jgi:hypothetical protein
MPTLKTGNCWRMLNWKFLAFQAVACFFYHVSLEMYEFDARTFAWIFMLVFDMLLFPLPLVVLLSYMVLQGQSISGWSRLVHALYAANVLSVLWRYQSEVLNPLVVFAIIIFLTTYTILLRYGLLPSVR